MDKHRIILFGFGSIGKRYIRILKDYQDIEVCAFRSTREGGLRADIKEIYNWDEAARFGASIAVITNPTFLHIETAIRCAELGMHLYIEKPLDMNLSRLPELVDIVGRKGLTAYVAYNLRFHPGIKELKRIVEKKKVWHVSVCNRSWLPSWRPGTDYSEVYSAKKEEGGGVLLDLSHEPDYIQYVFGKIKSIEGTCKKASNLKVDVEDTADIIIRLDNGIDVPVHLDFCSYCPQRYVDVMTEDGFYHLDFIKGCMEVYEEHERTVKNYNIERDDLYKAQVDYFLSRIGEEHIMNNLSEAGELLVKILKFREVFL